MARRRRERRRKAGRGVTGSAGGSKVLAGMGGEVGGVKRC